ncbi:SDR family NAD(P)-dependent oxidoreductase [Nitratireductor sp. CH_MIT9313-5]|uniref:SDR family NAD(P)-dependent oxidoreductase n=1 Tax=Nitratireductor sp. CH_MIT9313-5 TaxID=3107764 RepID=UPI00300A4CC4
MSRLLEGQVMIVTGAAAGIGRGILRQLVRAGADVTGFDVNRDGADAVESEGGRFMQVDVRDLDALDHAIRVVDEKHGPLQGLVNNAGITINVPFLEMTREQMETLWEINQRSVLAACQSAARVMVESGTRGAIVNIASNHARCSNPGMEAYAGTKGAITALTRAMAWSLGPHGIRVNALCPGLTMTEKVIEAAHDPETAQMFNSWHATGDLNSVEDVGNVAAFLLSDQSASLTGSEIIADRGMSGFLGARRSARQE